MLVEDDNQEEGERGNEYPLTDKAHEDRLGLAEHLGKGARLDAEGYTVHHDGQGDIQHIHTGLAEIDFYGVEI